MNLRSDSESLVSMTFTFIYFFPKHVSNIKRLKYAKFLLPSFTCLFNYVYDFSISIYEKVHKFLNLKP